MDGVSNGQKSNGLVRFLVVVILILLMLVVYAYAVKPYINSYVVQKQIEAKDYVLDTIINQVNTTGYVELTMGNKSLILVPYQQPALSGASGK
jgi:hypothetical protein